MEVPTTTNYVCGSNMKPPEQSTFSTKNSFETTGVQNCGGSDGTEYLQQSHGTSLGLGNSQMSSYSQLAGMQNHISSILNHGFSTGREFGTSLDNHTGGYSAYLQEHPNSGSPSNTYLWHQHYGQPPYYYNYPTTVTTGGSNADVNEAYTVHSIQSVKQTAPVDPLSTLQSSSTMSSVATTTPLPPIEITRPLSPVQTTTPGSSLRPEVVEGTPTNKISTGSENGVPEETMTQDNFQVGRIKEHWMGSYTSAGDDKNVFPDDSELFFYIIETQECGEDRVQRVVQSMVPTTWLSNDGKFVLYPPPSKKKSDNPVNWAKSTYRRKAYPELTWMEYSVERIINHDEQLVFREVVKRLKDIQRGKTLEIVRQSEGEGGGRGSRTKVANKRYADSTNDGPVESMLPPDKRVRKQKSTNANETVVTRPPKPTIKKPSSIFRPFHQGSGRSTNHVNGPSEGTVGGGNVSNGTELNVLPTPPSTSRDEDIHKDPENVSVLEISKQTSLDESCFNDSGFESEVHLYNTPSPSRSTPIHKPTNLLRTLDTNQEAFQDRLSNIETELRAIKGTITQGFTQLLKKIEHLTIDSTLKFNLTDMKYHDEVIKKALGKLPFDTIEKVVAANTLAEQLPIAVSMVCQLRSKYQSAVSITKFVSFCFRELFDDIVLDALHWKPKQVGEEVRPGLGKLFHLLAVIGVATKSWCIFKKVPILTLHELTHRMKAVRKRRANVYRGVNEKESDAFTRKGSKGLAGGDADIVKLESYIELLEKGLSTFTIEK